MNDTFHGNLLDKTPSISCQSGYTHSHMCIYLLQLFLVLSELIRRSLQASEYYVS